MNNRSDRPPPYIPRWGQDTDDSAGSWPGVQGGPPGARMPVAEEGDVPPFPDRPPFARAPDPHPVPEWPRQRVQPRRRGLGGKVLRFSLSFGLAAVATLVVVLMLNRPAVQDTRSPQNAASNSFTTRFKGEGEPQATVEPAPANRERAAATAPKVAGVGPQVAVPDLPPARSEAAAPPSARPQPLQAPPSSPALPALGREEVDILFKQGEGFVAVGDFASARVVFRRAAESGDVRAALALGATYDPILLARMGAKGMTPDVAQARAWYTRAREYGSAEAAGRLQALANAQ